MIELQPCDRKKLADVVRTVFVPGAILSETDCNGRITYVSDKLAELHQCEGEELLGTLDDMLACGCASDDMVTSINRLITSGRIFTGVLKERTRNGNHFWVDATIVPVKDERGCIFKYVLAKYPIMDNLMGEYLYKKQAKRFGLSLG